MSHKDETVEGYSFEKKKRLASKISDMRDKPTLRMIRDIILAENPEIAVKKSSNGYLMYFQSYTPDTYKKIEKLLNKLEKERLEQQARTITETSEHIMMSSEDPNTDYTLSRTRLRYSNREKRLIKRQQYEEIVNEQNAMTVNTTEYDDESENEDVKIVTKAKQKTAQKTTTVKGKTKKQTGQNTVTSTSAPTTISTSVSANMKDDSVIKTKVSAKNKAGITKKTANEKQPLDKAKGNKTKTSSTAIFSKIKN